MWQCTNKQKLLNIEREICHCVIKHHTMQVYGGTEVCVSVCVHAQMHTHAYAQHIYIHLHMLRGMINLALCF